MAGVRRRYDSCLRPTERHYRNDLRPPSISKFVPIVPSVRDCLRAFSSFPDDGQQHGEAEIADQS